MATEPDLRIATGAELDRLAFDRFGTSRDLGETDDHFRTRLREFDRIRWGLPTLVNAGNAHRRAEWIQVACSILPVWEGGFDGFGDGVDKIIAMADARFPVG